MGVHMGPPWATMGPMGAHEGPWGPMGCQYPGMPGCLGPFCLSNILAYPEVCTDPSSNGDKAVNVPAFDMQLANEAEGLHQKWLGKLAQANQCNMPLRAAKNVEE